MITAGKADGNPTTILEAMAWGLIPVCTPQSGYVDYSSIPNIPLNDINAAVKIIKDLQNMPEDILRQWQKENWNLLDAHFNWERFADQVIEAINFNENPAIDKPCTKIKASMLWAEITNPFWFRNIRSKPIKKYFELFGGT
jgi:hypothetical protein